MTGTPLASLPEQLRHKLTDAVRAFRARRPADRTVRVILGESDAAPCCVVGRSHRLRLTVAIRTGRTDGRGPVEAVYTLEPLSTEP